jgi:hypothetical protein
MAIERTVRCHAEPGPKVPHGVRPVLVDLAGIHTERHQGEHGGQPKQYDTRLRQTTHNA